MEISGLMMSKNLRIALHLIALKIKHLLPPKKFSNFDIWVIDCLLIIPVENTLSEM